MPPSILILIVLGIFALYAIPVAIIYLDCKAKGIQFSAEDKRPLWHRVTWAFWAFGEQDLQKFTRWVHQSWKKTQSKVAAPNPTSSNIAKSSRF